MLPGKANANSATLVVLVAVLVGRMALPLLSRYIVISVKKILKCESLPLGKAGSSMPPAYWGLCPEHAKGCAWIIWPWLLMILVSLTSASVRVVVSVFWKVVMVETKLVALVTVMWSRFPRVDCLLSIALMDY